MNDFISISFYLCKPSVVNKMGVGACRCLREDQVGQHDLNPYNPSNSMIMLIPADDLQPHKSKQHKAQCAGTRLEHSFLKRRKRNYYMTIFRELC